MILVTEIVNFILRYRKNGKAFDYGESSTELYNIISNAIDRNCCLVDADFLDNIKGVVVGEIQKEYNRIHIHGIISISNKSTKKFARWFRDCYEKEGYSLVAERRGKFIEYNTPRLLDKLCQLK